MKLTEDHSLVISFSEQDKSIVKTLLGTIDGDALENLYDDGCDKTAELIDRLVAYSGYGQN